MCIAYEVSHERLGYCMRCLEKMFVWTCSSFENLFKRVQRQGRTSRLGVWRERGEWSGQPGSPGRTCSLWHSKYLLVKNTSYLSRHISLVFYTSKTWEISTNLVAGVSRGKRKKSLCGNISRYRKVKNLRKASTRFSDALNFTREPQGKFTRTVRIPETLFSMSAYTRMQFLCNLRHPYCYGFRPNRHGDL